jgi:hypothetical protein
MPLAVTLRFSPDRANILLILSGFGRRVGNFHRTPARGPAPDLAFSALEIFP